MRHLTALQLCAFLDDALVGTMDDQTARHLGSCPLCRDRYESWCHVDDALREMLGQVPDEHSMEQRSSWVEIAVTADRKGLPAPEFAELRLPLNAPGAPAPYAPPPASSHFAPPYEPQYTPQPGPGPRQATPIPYYAPEPPSYPTLPPAPVGHVTVTGGPPAHGSTRFAMREPSPPAPTPGADRYARANPSGVAGPGLDPNQSHAPLPPGYRVRAYARMPRAPRHGLAALVYRPVSWVTLILLIAVAIALPYTHPELGLPRIPLPFTGTRAGAHPAVAQPVDAPAPKPAVDAGHGTEHATPVVPSGSGKRPRPVNTPPPGNTNLNPGQPDASILFDLPAIEPEDDEPDPAGPGASPGAPSPGKGRSTAPDAGNARNDRPQLCGEVRTSQGTPIEGAKVILSSPAMVVRTDRRGRFCLACPPGRHTIRIESAGRSPIVREVRIGREKLETRFTFDASN